MNSRAEMTITELMEILMFALVFSVIVIPTVSNFVNQATTHSAAEVAANHALVPVLSIEQKGISFVPYSLLFSGTADVCDKSITKDCTPNLKITLYPANFLPAECGTKPCACAYAILAKKSELIKCVPINAGECSNDGAKVCSAKPCVDTARTIQVGKEGLVWCRKCSGQIGFGSSSVRPSSIEKSGACFG